MLDRALLLLMFAVLLPGCAEPRHCQPSRGWQPDFQECK